MSETNVRVPMMSEPAASPTPGSATRYGWYTENEVLGSPTLQNISKKQQATIVYS